MNTVLPLYAPLPTPVEMSRWDMEAEATYGIPSLVLMENAARAALEELKGLTPLRHEQHILVYMGKGNNGGDGAALARMLFDESYNVLICPMAELEEMSGAAKAHALMAKNIGVPFLPVSHDGPPELPKGWDRPDIVIDALTGTGLRGDLRPRELAVVRAINSFLSRPFVFALDIPSGLCGYTGRPLPEAVKAHATVCFEAGKPGLFFPEARAHTGTLSIRRVGIPMAVRATHPASWRLLRPTTGPWAKPSPFRHKGDAGRVLIIGGSDGMAGAPLLAAQGCLRCGAGLVHLAIPTDLESAVRAACPEVLSHAVGTGRQWRDEDASALLDIMRSIRPNALVVGPGMGRSAAVRAIVAALLEEKKRPPIILDADGLFWMRFDETVPTEEGAIPLSSLRRYDILTPHPGEMARMLPATFFASQEQNVPAQDDQADLSRRIALLQNARPEAVRAFTQHASAVLVLKGPGSLIGQQDAPTVLSPFAVAALGVGGSGDVLAGAMAALVASGINAMDAACMAVYMHGRAAELLTRVSPLGHTAGELARTLPQVWDELCTA